MTPTFVSPPQIHRSRKPFSTGSVRWTKTGAVGVQGTEPSLGGQGGLPIGGEARRSRSLASPSPEVLHIQTPSPTFLH